MHAGGGVVASCGQHQIETGRGRAAKERDPFRTSMVYSNLGYAALGEAAAAAAKMPFVDLVRTRLVEPLGMRDTTVGIDHTLAENHASSHGMVDGVHRPIRTRKLKKGRIRGVVSEGMLCSGKELGLSEDHSAIFVLAPEAPVGAPLAAWLSDGAIRRTA